MRRLFDEAELKEWVENWFYQNKYYHPYSKSNSIPCSELYDILERMPTIDAVEVARCGECIHHEEPRDTFLKAFVWCNFYNTRKLKNGYCNCGERKDEEEQNDD